METYSKPTGYRITQRRVFILFFVLAVLLLLYTINPAQSVLMPKCVFFWITGFQCPACGSQRAIHQLLHLHWETALTLNPFLVISMPYLIALATAQWFNTKGFLDPLKHICHHPITVKIYLCLLIAWWIIRNIYK